VGLFCNDVLNIYIVALLFLYWFHANICSSNIAPDRVHERRASVDIRLPHHVDVRDAHGIPGAARPVCRLPCLPHCHALLLKTHHGEPPTHVPWTAGMASKLVFLWFQFDIDISYRYALLACLSLISLWHWHELQVCPASLSFFDFTVVLHESTYALLACLSLISLWYYTRAHMPC